LIDYPRSEVASLFDLSLYENFLYAYVFDDHVILGCQSKFILYSQFLSSNLIFRFYPTTVKSSTFVSFGLTLIIFDGLFELFIYHSNATVYQFYHFYILLKLSIRLIALLKRSLSLIFSKEGSLSENYRYSSFS